MYFPPPPPKPEPQAWITIAGNGIVVANIDFDSTMERPLASKYGPSTFLPAKGTVLYVQGGFIYANHAAPGVKSDVPEPGKVYQVVLGDDICMIGDRDGIHIARRQSIACQAIIKPSEFEMDQYLFGQADSVRKDPDGSVTHTWADKQGQHTIQHKSVRQ